MHVEGKVKESKKGWLVTILRRKEIDIASGGVPADADGGEGFEVGEGVVQLSVRDFRTEVADVERRW